MTDIAASTAENLWSRDYFFIVMACLATSVCGYLFFSTLPIYVQRITGTARYAGLVTGLYTLSALVMRPMIGNLIERWGRRRVLLAGSALAVVSCSLYGVAGGLAAFLAVRVIHGIGFSACTTATGAAAVDVIPRARLSEGLGYYSLSPTVAAAVAPAIALWIIGDGAPGDFVPLFLVGVAVSVVGLLLASAVTYERRRPAVRPVPAEAPAASSAKRTGALLGFQAAQLWPSVVLLLVSLAYSSILSFVALFAMERGLGNAGAFFAFYAGGTLLSRLLLGRVTDRYGANVVMVPSLILAVVTLGLIGLADSLAFLLAIAVPMGFAIGAISTTLNAVLVRFSSADAVGSATAAYYASMDLGYGAGAIACGWMVAAKGYGFVYGCASGLCALAVGLYLACVSGKARQAHRATRSATAPAAETEAAAMDRVA